MTPSYRRLALPCLSRSALGISTLSVLLTTTLFALPHPESKWRPEASDGNWDTPGNWVPTRVPNAVQDQAVFNFSTITTVTTAFALVHSINFNPGASQFTINGPITFNNGGVINASGLMQTLNGTYRFQNGANAGDLVTYNTSGVFFGKGTSAGNATFVNSGLLRFEGGLRVADFTTAGNATFINNGTIRFHKADAGTANFTNNGGTTFGAPGSEIVFAKSSAVSSTIVNNGGAVFGGRGSRLEIHKSTSDSATFIANGGAGPGSGATILFTTGSTGNLARIEVFGNGNLDVSRPGSITDGVGSIEGTGLVFLGSSHLDVGANSLSTTFDGVISDMGGIKDGTSGSLTKSGSGTLILTNENTYTGATIVSAGALLANNAAGSATGSGAVAVNAGTLGGNGTVAGAVTIGTGGGGSGAFLSPGGSGAQVGAFATQGALTFKADAVFQEEVNSPSQMADEVVANGVSIDASAQFALTDLGAGTLPMGTVFIIINNAASTPIAGTFANLGDGASLTVGGNSFQASYEGGDGNDLMLTVVP